MTPPTTLRTLFTCLIAGALLLSACGSSATDVVDSATDAASDAADTATDAVEAVEDAMDDDETMADDAMDDTDHADDESTDSDAGTADTETTGSDAGTADTADTETTGSQNVEINLLDELDGILTGYCLDIAGGNENVDPANGLQAHTCYSYRGDLGTDQIFATAQFASDALYMSDYDVCAQIDSLAAGSAISLTSCDGSELQTIVFEADGTLRPAADTTLCFTAGAESRTGRSGDHQIRDLSIETCADDLASLQQWGFRTGA